MAPHLCLVVVQFIFAAFPVCAKIAFREMTPLAVAFIRISSASLILLVWFYLASDDHVEPRDYARFAGFSFLGVFVNQLCYLLGLEQTTAIHSTILIGATPVFAYAAAVLLRREALTSTRMLGILLACSGVVVLVRPAAVWNDTGMNGNLLLLTSSFAYAIYLVLSRDLMSRYRPVTVVTWVFTFGAIGIAPFCWNDVIEIPFASLATTTWASLAFLVVLGSIATYSLNGIALKSVPASVVAVYICTQPIIGAVLAVPILGEHVTTRMVAAFALIAGGICLSAVMPASARREAW